MQDGQKIVPVIFLHVSMQAEILEAEVLQVVVVLVIGHKDPVDQAAVREVNRLAAQVTLNVHILVALLGKGLPVLLEVLEQMAMAEQPVMLEEQQVLAVNMEMQEQAYLVVVQEVQQVML